MFLKNILFYIFKNKIGKIGFSYLMYLLII